MEKIILIIISMFLFSCVGDDDSSTPATQEVIKPHIYEVEFLAQGVEPIPGQEIFQTDDIIDIEIRSENNSENTYLEINVYLLPSTEKYYPTELFELTSSENTKGYKMTDIEMEWYDYGNYRIEFKIISLNSESETFVKYMTHEEI